MSTNNKHIYDCIIIGSGIAGLSGAITLTEKGVDNYLILEARERPGGRIFSQQTKGGHIAELGAERIGSTHKTILSLCKKFGITKKDKNLVDHTFNFYLDQSESGPLGVYKNHIHGYKSKKITQFLHKFKNRKDKKIKKYNNLSTEMLIFNILNENMQLEMADLEISNEFGEDIKFLPASRYIIDSLTGGLNAHCDYKIRGGNSILIKSICEYIGESHIIYGAIVCNINYDSPIYIVKTKQNQTFYARYILCTIPLPQYSKIQRNNTISNNKLSLSYQVPYGRIIKTGFVLKNTKVPNSYGLINDSILHTIYNSGKSHGKDKHTTLIGIYATGDRAYLLSKMKQNEIFKQLIANTNISDEARYIDSYHYYWGEDEFSGGAFAFYPLGKDFSGIRRAGKREKNIFFAGEHTSQKFQGFMEGAAQEGIHKAKKICKELCR